MDVATLGLSVDTSQVATAVTRLRELAAQGAATGASINIVSQSSAQMQQAMNRAAVAAETMMQ